jgi:hypothetical protein
VDRAKRRFSTCVRHGTSADGSGRVAQVNGRGEEISGQSEKLRRPNGFGGGILRDVEVVFTLTGESGRSTQVIRVWSVWVNNEVKTVPTPGRKYQKARMAGTARSGKQGWEQLRVECEWHWDWSRP